MKTAKIFSIIPDHNPVAVAQQMVERSTESRGAFYILVDKDGKVTWDMGSITMEEILWGLTRAQHAIMLECDDA